MHRIFAVLMALTLFLAGAGIASAETYNLDPAHSHVMFKVKHLGISTVTGRFEAFAGTFDFDPAKVSTGATSVTIDVGSINTDVEDRDNHLKSAEFFDAEQFPEISFTSKKVQSVDGNEFEIVGDLTIRGVTKSVTLDVELGGTVTDPWGNERAAFTATTKIDRKDFGLVWNKVLETGGLVVGNEVRISLEIEGIKAKTTG